MVLLFLCLAIPSYGFASLGVAMPVCPMEPQHHGSSQMQEATAVVDMDRDCCVDLETFSRTGQHCKVGQDCHAGTLAWVEPPPMSFAVPVPSTLALPGPDDARRDRTGGVVWRPPRFL